MWDVLVPVVGHCRECGDDLSTEVTVRATQDWVDQYQYDGRMRRGIEHAVVRLVVARHNRRCVGRPRQRLALAPSARAERAPYPERSRQDRSWESDIDTAPDASRHWDDAPAPRAAAVRGAARAGFAR